MVVKVSGLALGKGVIVCRSHDQASAAVRAILADGAFGGAGAQVVVEDFLQGEELSLHALSDGHDYRLFPGGRDHKPIGDGDTGPNTGGMGTGSRPRGDLPPSWPVWPHASSSPRSRRWRRRACRRRTSQAQLAATGPTSSLERLRILANTQRGVSQPGN